MMSQSNFRKTVFFLFCTVVLGTFLGGQTLADIDTIMVKTTRIPLRSTETGRNISILKGEDLQKMAITSLDDLFRYVPGIEVQNRNAFGAQGDISMRGVTFSQVMVLVDGMRINDPLTAHFNSYIPVTPSEIERIEVLRGASSAMYGADAVGGVINIITKGFARNGEEGSQLNGQVNYGENHLVNAQQGFSVSREKFYVGGGFNMNQSDGQYIAEKTVEGNSLEGYNNYFNLKTFGLSMGYRLSENWTAQARTSYDDRDFSARFFYTTSPLDKSTETARNWWNLVQLRRTGTKSSTDFKLAHRYGTDEFVFSPDFPSTNLHTTQFWNFNANHLYIVNDQLSLNVGGQLDRRSIESTDRGDHQDWHAGTYFMGVWRPNSQLNLTGSLRFDYDENYGLEFTPQLNISYVLPRITFRGAVGRTIRAADYTERYVSYNLENLTPGRSLGNPDLEAERAWSEEIGVDYRLAKNWQLKATGFLRQSNNLIDYIATNEMDIPNNENLQDGAEYFYAENLSKVNTQGIEVESWLRHSFGSHQSIQWSLGYTFLKTTSNEDVVSVYIASHARHLLSTNLILQTGKFELALNGVYKERNERIASGINARLTPNYQVWNMRLGYQLTPQLGLNFQVHNLFDEDYQDILGAQMPARWLMGGIKFKI